jgi:hypothetical protein
VPERGPEGIGERDDYSGLAVEEPAEVVGHVEVVRAVAWAK